MAEGKVAQGGRYRHCVEYYNPCDISRKGTHVRVRRCKRFAPGPG